MKTIEEKIAVMQAFAEGKEIEIYDKHTAKWTPAINPDFNWKGCDYRIKEEPEKPEYIPFSFEDAEQLIGKVVKSKDENWIEMITWCGNGEASSIPYSTLLYDYTFLDGSPCGKLKQTT